jgi:hypothetical protein
MERLSELESSSPDGWVLSRAMKLMQAVAKIAALAMY